MNTHRRSRRRLSPRKRARRAYLRRYQAECAFVRRQRSSQDRGFTMLEIMVVLAIIGLISAAIGTGVMKSLQTSRLRTAKLQVREIVGAAQQAMLDDNACPTIDDLVKRGQLRNTPKDPWGNPMVLRCPSEHEKDPVDVICSGPDKKADTEDDIKSWEL